MNIRYNFINCKPRCYLPKDEMNNLIAKAQNGDDKAQSKIIYNTMGYVISISNVLFNSINNLSYYIDCDELIHQGVIGIIKSINKFDFSKNATFLTYASYWIKHYIISFIKSSTLYETVEDISSIGNLIHNVVEDYRKKILDYGISKLKNIDTRTYYIICSIYELNDYDKKSINKLAIELHIHPARVRQLRDEGINILKRIIIENKLPNSLFNDLNDNYNISI